MKAILFCRVSSKEQEESGYSLPAQEKLLTEYAYKHGIEISKVFAISESASGKKQRETFDKMLEFTKKHNITVIVCEKVDRLTRNLKDAVSINEWIDKDDDRQVHFVKENTILSKNSRSNEKFIWNIKVSVAQYYIDNLSEEVKKGQKEKIAQGWLPTKPPLGYKTVGEKGHKIHVIDEPIAPLIKKMFDLYANQDYSLERLTKEMHESGLRSTQNNNLSKSRIHDYLTDPFYIGKMVWNGEIYKGKHQPLIDTETFDRVQQKLKSKTTPKYNKHFFLFKGMLQCEECKGTITWEKQKGIIYGHCNHYRNCTQQLWAKEDAVEKQLIRSLEGFEIKSTRFVEWIGKALKESHQDEIAYYSSSVNELRQRQDQLQLRKERLYDDKLDGKITEEFYNRKNKQFTDELEEVTDQLKKHSNANMKYYELGSAIFDLSQRSKEIYLKGSPRYRRQLLELMFENLYLNEGKLSFTLTKPFQVLKQAIDITNSSKLPENNELEKNIFEPEENIIFATKKESFDSLRSVMLHRAYHTSNQY